jgi:outer membrane protein assembly factor BamB
VACPGELRSLPKNFPVCWNKGAGCSPPTDPFEATLGGCEQPVPPELPGEKQVFKHEGLDAPETYCYSVFTLYPAISAEIGEVVTRTFDSTPPNPLQWSFTPGEYAGGGRGVAVEPPTVGLDGVYSVGSDGVVYSMERGLSGGPWPVAFYPLALGKRAHNRNAVVPLPEGSRFFVGTESGEVHSVNAKNGSIVWSRAALFPAGSQQLMPGSTGTQAPPAGVFKAFGGQNDVLLVGTAQVGGNTQFFELDSATGATLDAYPDGVVDLPPDKIDNVFGMAVVDYAKNRVYFGTSAGSFTLWALDLGAPTPDLTLSSLPWNPQPLGTVLGTAGAPVFRNDRLYLGTDSGAASQVHAIPVSGGTPYGAVHGDGQVKGFVWPDRRDDRLYFTTDNFVFGMKDDGTKLADLWPRITGISNPSIPLQMPGTDFLYVGDNNGNLVEIDVKTGTVITSIKLSASDVRIGAPSLDNVNRMIHVGSADGVIYAVRVPF